MAALACAAPPPPPAPAIALRADPISLEILEGTWSGEYSSAETGRRGKIRFELEAAEGGVAHGDVLSFGDVERLEDPSLSDPPGARGDLTRRLRISFVSVEPEREAVSGTLEPYRDPECECLLSTTFYGEVREGAIEGTYVSRGPAGHPTTRGRWRVERVPERGGE